MIMVADSVPGLKSGVYVPGILPGAADVRRTRMTRRNVVGAISGRTVCAKRSVRPASRTN